MGIYFEDNNPGAPWCECGCLCDGSSGDEYGWCSGCNDWAVEIQLDGQLKFYNPKFDQFAFQGYNGQEEELC